MTSLVHSPINAYDLEDGDPFAGVIVKAPNPTLANALTRFGLHQDGHLYQWGDSYGNPRVRYAQDDALPFQRIAAVQLMQLHRECLSIGFVMDGRPCALILPANGSQDPEREFRSTLPVRSLLGALRTLDLSGVSGTISARLGKPAASNRKPRWIDIHINDAMPELPGLSLIREPLIGPTRRDLELSIDDCRTSLHLPLQFP